MNFVIYLSLNKTLPFHKCGLIESKYIVGPRPVANTTVTIIIIISFDLNDDVLQWYYQITNELWKILYISF